MKQRYVMMSAHKEMRGLEYLVYSAFSLVLLIVLVFLPLAPVFADEIVAEDVSSVQIVTPNEGPVVEEQNELPQATETQEEAVSPSAEPHTVSLDVTESEIVVPDSIPEATEITSDTVIEEVSNFPTEVPIEEGSGELLPESGSTTNPVPEVDTPLDETVPEVPVPEVTPLEEVLPKVEVIPETESLVEESTPSTTVEVPVVNVVTNDENKFSFSKDECTTVGDGTFYCATASEIPTVLHTDRIFAAIDAEGDKEIYVEKNGELNTITNNQFDDDAPYFDEVSNTAVWHRLIDGRYQIIQFDFETGEEIQLTNDRFNNMQPSAFGDSVVWQGWVGNDWEIFFDNDGELEMLTDNTTQDIAPSVNGTHIVWQSFEGDAWRMKVYDIRTGAINTIEDADGGSILNPRFVLVYDAKMDTGDIETRGYDLKSGEILDLASRPTPVPEEIPDPEQTGEERALVASSTQPKPKTDSDEGDDIGTTTDNGLDEGDLVIPALTDDISSTSTSEVTIETNDVVIPAFSEGTTTDEIITIEDLVVEPYVPFEDVLNEEVQI